MRPPVFFSSEKRKKTTAHIFLSLPALFTKKSTGTLPFPTVYATFYQPSRTANKNIFFHKNTRCPGSAQHALSKTSFPFAATLGFRYLFIRQEALGIPNPKTSFSFAAALGFQYLFIRQEAPRHIQIRKLRFHLSLLSAFTIFAGVKNKRTTLDKKYHHG